MIKLINLIGARPQIIKAAAISRAIKKSYSDSIQDIVVHTGQHYDKNMSGHFFEQLDIPYFIGGSLASTLYGMVRTTQDSDIVAEMRLEHLKPFASALEDEFYVDDEMIADSIQHKISFNIIHRESMFRIFGGNCEL